MANGFITEDRTIFSNVIKAFNDNLNVSMHTAKYGTDGELMERANDIINRPVPLRVTDEARVVGTDTTARDVLEMKVPSQLNINRTVPLKLNALEQRDARRMEEMTKATGRKLSSRIEQEVQNVIFNQGALCSAISGTSKNAGYDGPAEAESLMLELGLDGYDRCMAINARDYNGLAGDLSKASRSFGNEMSDGAYRRSFVGEIAGFDTYKMGASKRLNGTTGSCTLDTTGANVQYAPVADADNRTQTITFNSVSNVNVGDRFTVDGIEAVNMESKVSTGQPKTFVVTAVSGNDLTISPPMIGKESGATNAQQDYQNIKVASTSATAAVTFLNQNASNVNYFWTKDSVEILLGRYAAPANEGTQVMRGTTDQGVELLMTKEFSGKNLVSLYHFDIFFGVTNLDPEKNGVQIYGQ